MQLFLNAGYQLNMTFEVPLKILFVSFDVGYLITKCDLKRIAELKVFFQKAFYKTKLARNL